MKVKTRTITWNGGAVTIPDTAVITVTENCDSCDFVCKTLGRKMACGHQRILAARPYIEGAEKTRKVEPETIPEWCPLRANDPSNKE